MGLSANIAWNGTSVLHGASILNTNSSYSEYYSIACQQFPQLSSLGKLWWTHYAYWDSDMLATGKMLPSNSLHGI